MANTTGSVDLSVYMRKDEHKASPDGHRMGTVLPYADIIMPSNPRKGVIGDGETVAASNHVHANAPVYIRQDSVAGSDDHLFSNQIINSPTSILQGTMVGSVDPGGDGNKRLLGIRFGFDWYYVILSKDTFVAGGNAFSAVNQDAL